ncbi:TetR/AcrR family transcriptional regulator [Dactylosporangium sp. NPDC049525]|uniref:TetR/AcrR family transcriptional regulator n=1 Tax=Dactylosporangium sp. NPDC049525 TaxID=3154730 RepID=UPI003432117E
MKPPTKAQLARAARRDRIVAAAREIAQVEGWGAVTVRRLADAIAFSQPVLYSHFPDGRDGIVRAVALEGFTHIAAALAGAGPDVPAHLRLRPVAECYLAFAQEHPAVYEAMFSGPTDLAFATPAAPEQLRAGFAALAAVVGGDETRAETLWSALHGLADLARHGRLRPGREPDRLTVLVELFAGPAAG